MDIMEAEIGSEVEDSTRRKALKTGAVALSGSSVENDWLMRWRGLSPYGL